MDDAEKWAAYAHWESHKPALADRPRKRKDHAHNCPTGLMWACGIELAICLIVWGAAHFWR